MILPFVIKICAFLGVTIFSAFTVADIVVDGGSATSVALNTDGVEVVNIAASNADGVSYNSYTKFNVPEKGAILSNPATGANASTIINEVTSSNISHINGPLRVSGVKAHTIIANPNGIVVDGGRFINTGNVMLTTGTVSYKDVPSTGGSGVQKNIILTTTQGEVTIQGGGLSGAMDAIDIIAKSIRINAAIELQNKNSDQKVNPLQEVSINAGESEAEIDVSVVPSNALGNQRVTTKSLSASAAGQVLIDITSQGSLYAGTVQIVVNDHGAGVRHAGSIYADGNSFTLSADGSISNDYSLELVGGEIKASATEVSANNYSGGHVLISAESVELKSDQDKQSKIIAENGAVEIATIEDFINRGGLIQGDRKNSSRPLTSLGGISFDVGRNLYNETASAKHLGIIFSRNDNLSIKVAGDLTNKFARIISNQEMSFDVGGDFNNILEYTDFTDRGKEITNITAGKRVWQRFFLQREQIRTMEVDFGRLTLSGGKSFIVSNGDLNIQANNVINQGGEIDANGSGSINITAQRIVNETVLTGVPSICPS